MKECRWMCHKNLVLLFKQKDWHLAPHYLKDKVFLFVQSLLYLHCRGETCKEKVYKRFNSQQMLHLQSAGCTTLKMLAVAIHSSITSKQNVTRKYLLSSFCQLGL